MDGALFNMFERREAGSATRKPRFTVGEAVIAVVPDTLHSGKLGLVVDVIKSPGPIYRYRVHFNDGSISTFFGFELDWRKRKA